MWFDGFYIISLCLFPEYHNQKDPPKKTAPPKWRLQFSLSPHFRSINLSVVFTLLVTLFASGWWAAGTLVYRRWLLLCCCAKAFWKKKHDKVWSFSLMIRLFAWGFFVCVCAASFFTTIIIIIIVELTQSTFYYVCKVNNRGPAFEASFIFPKRREIASFWNGYCDRKKEKRKTRWKMKKRLGSAKGQRFAARGIDSRLAGKPGQTHTDGTRFWRAG